MRDKPVSCFLFEKILLLWQSSLHQARFIKASLGMEDRIQLLHKVAIILNNWGTSGLDLSHSAFLMKLAGQFFQDP